MYRLNTHVNCCCKSLCIHVSLLHYLTHTNRGTIMSNKTKKTTTKKISKKTFENAMKWHTYIIEKKLTEQGINVDANVEKLILVTAIAHIDKLIALKKGEVCLNP